MKKIVLCGLLASMMGCATVPPGMTPITTEPREFTYDYLVPGKSKAELFRAARNYLALAYGDSRSVLRSEDEADGTYIGKAIIPWDFTTGSAMLPSFPCASNYNIVFIAKDGKARMQLTLLEGAAHPTSCAGWPLPPKQDYPQIVAKFNDTSHKLEQALKGQSPMEALKNF